MLDCYEKTLTTLRKDGIAMSPVFLTPTQIADTNRYLSMCLVYNAHVRAKSNSSMLQYEAINGNKWPMFTVDMRDAVLAPHLFELMLGYYEFAKAYFDGEQPILYSMNCFWTQPAPGSQPYQDTHGWHRDLDDRKQLVVFVFGTDVWTADDGAHLYQRGTQNVSDQALGRDFRLPPPDIIETISGAAGTVFLSDTRGLHIGLRPRKLRMLAWGRWGVSTPPQSYAWDALKPVDKALLGARYPSGEDKAGLRDAIRFVVS